MSSKHEGVFRRATVVLVSGFVALVACGGEERPALAPVAVEHAKDPAALTSIAQACARVSSCTHAHDAVRYRDPGACVDWWLSEADAKEPLRACLSAATSCDAVSACMYGGGDARAATFCSQRPGVVSGCDGDRLVSCGDDDAHESSVVDCAAMGGSCRELKSPGGLVVRSCYSAQKCPAGAPEARCDGKDAVLSCRDGAFERVACRPGTACRERKDDSGEAAASCELTGAERRCDVRGARHCEDDRLVECERGNGPFGKVKVTDCVGFGLRCAGAGPRAGCYVPSNVECDKELLPKCEGGAVVFCAAGRVAKVSCGAIGLGACDPAAKGPMAACAAQTTAARVPAPQAGPSSPLPASGAPPKPAK